MKININFLDIFTLRCRVNRPLALGRWGRRLRLSQSMLKIVLKLAPEVICVLIKVHYGISEGHWSKPGPKSTLVVVLLLVLVFQNSPKTGSRSHLNASKCIMESLKVIGPNQVQSPLCCCSPEC